jgi:hypothetical protein
MVPLQLTARTVKPTNPLKFESLNEIAADLRYRSGRAPNHPLSRCSFLRRILIF